MTKSAAPPRAKARNGPRRRNGLTELEAAFIQEYSSRVLTGQKIVLKDIAIAAGYSEKSAPQIANKLIRKPEIQVCIQRRTRARTLTSIIDEAYLDAIALEVVERSLESNQLHVTLRAIELLGRDRGHFIERKDLTVRRPMTDDEKERRLNELLQRIESGGAGRANQPAGMESPSTSTH